MSEAVTFDDSVLDRMVLAVEKVRDRLLRSTASLEAAGIPYAVAEGHAVAAWVATIDEGGVRNTPDVDILIGREDFKAAKSALESVGFLHCRVAAIEMFLDGPDGKERSSVRLFFAEEMIRYDDLLPSPALHESVDGAEFRIVTLEALVRMKLIAHRRKDRVHLRDMIDVELIDESWPAKYPGELGERLQALLDDPDG